MSSHPPTNENDPLLLKDKNKKDLESSTPIPTTLKDQSNSTTLTVSFFLMLFFQLGNRIFFKLATYPMYNYPLYLNMMSVLVYIPISFAYIIPMSIWMPHIITPEQEAIPKYKFAIMGSLDSLAGIMATFSMNYITNASIIVLIQQSAIPISMLISKVALNAQYILSQYIGAMIVMSGIVVVLIPTFFGQSTASNGASSDSMSQEDSSSELLWLILLTLSCIPMCLSSVYKEFALGEEEIDVVYLNGWVSVFQSLFAIPLCIPSAMLISLPINDITSNLYNGFLCNIGINSVLESTPEIPADDCEYAPFYVWTYIFFNVIYNILIIVILKYGSANILWLSSTVIVPLSNVAFSLPFIPNNQPLQFVDVIGLVIIMLGLIVYRFTSALLNIWNMITGVTTKEDLEVDKLAKSIALETEQKQTKYIGLNQIEAINTLIDSRVLNAQKVQLFRTPNQIRGTFLVRLGIPPSPLITMGPVGKSPVFNSKSFKTTPRIQSPLAPGSRRIKENDYEPKEIIKRRPAEI